MMENPFPEWDYKNIDPEELALFVLQITAPVFGKTKMDLSQFLQPGFWQRITLFCDYLVVKG